MEIWESVVRMVSALGVVLALILGLLAVARSAVGRRFLPVNGAPLVKILGSGPLGSRKHVMVVAVAGEVLIRGTTATDLVPLGKIADPEVAKRLIAEVSALHSGAPTGIPGSGNLEETARAHS